jgi:hypothetical protein
LAQGELLVLSEVVHVDVPVCLQPVLVGFDGERPNQAQTAFGIGEDAHDIGSAPDLLVEAFEDVGNRYDNDGAIWSLLEMSDFRRMVRPSGTGAPGAR